MLGNDQILWLVNSALVVILGFFIRMWINSIKESLKEIKDELHEKVSKETCGLHHKELRRGAHTHGILGAAGEVISI